MIYNFLLVENLMKQVILLHLFITYMIYSPSIPVLD